MNYPDYAPYIGEVQFGPVYHCWACGAPVGRLIPFHNLVPPPTLLDDYADHLAYLALPVSCKQARHPARVVVVGPAITPVDWPIEASPGERLRAIQEAIFCLTHVLAEKRAEPGNGFDAALATALRLYARVITPAQGAEEIRALTEVMQ